MATTEDIIRRLTVVAEERGISQLQQRPSKGFLMQGETLPRLRPLLRQRRTEQRAGDAFGPECGRSDREEGRSGLQGAIRTQPGIRKLAKAAAQGIDAEQINRAAEGLVRMSQAASDLDKIMVQAEQHVDLFKQRLAETELVEKRLAQTTAERAKRAKENLDYEERVRAAKASYAASDEGRHLDVVGASRQAATSQGAGFSALAAQAAEEDRLIKVTNELRQATNAEQEANIRLIKSTIDLAHAQKMGITAGIDMAKAHEYLAMKAGTATKGTGQLNASLTNLTYQLNDVVTGLATGQAGFTIFAQQAGQIAQALAQGGGVIPTLQGFAQKVSGFFTATRIAIGGAAAAAIGAAYAYNRYADMAISATITTKGLGVGLGLTRDQFLELTKAASEAGKVSVAVGLDIANSLARGTRLGASEISDLVKMSKDFAATWGTDLDEVNKKLVQTFSSVQGIFDLNKERAFLTGTQMDQIKILFEAGKEAQAARIAIEALKDRGLVKAEEATGTLTDKFKDLKRELSDLATSLGSYINNLTTVEAVEARVSARRKMGMPDAGASAAKLGAEMAAAGMGKGPTGGEVQGPPMPNKEDLATFEKLQDAMLKRSATARDYATALGTQTAAGARWIRTAEEFREIAANATAQQMKEIEAIEGVTEARDKAESTARALKDQQINLTDSGDKLARVQAFDARIALELDEKRKESLRIQRDELNLADQGMGATERRVRVTQSAVDSQVAHIKAVRDDVNYSKELRSTYGEVGDALEVANTMTQKRISYEQQGITLTKADTEAIKEQVQATVEHTRAQGALNKIYEEFVKPGEEFTRVINAADEMLAKGKINVNQYANAVLDAQIKMEQAKQTMEGGFTAGMLTVQKEFGNTSKMMESFVTSSANSMVTAIADMTDGTKKSGDAFRDLAKTVVRSLEEMVIKTMIVAPIMKALQDAISGAGGFSGILTSVFGGATGGTVKIGSGPYRRHRWVWQRGESLHRCCCLCRGPKVPPGWSSCR